MSANKVTLNNKVLIDLTADTVTENDVVSGVTFHKADGTTAVGTKEEKVLIEKEITANGEYPASADGADGFSKVIVNVESSGGGETLPEYDGTVIIEKAESVLGLRRFKETLSPIESAIAVTDQWGYFGVYKETHFEIEPLTVDELGITIYGMSPLVNFTDNNSPTDYPKIVISATENGGSTERTLMPVDFSNGNLVAGVVVNVISTNGTIVDEWLLANTQGVSV